MAELNREAWQAVSQAADRLTRAVGRDDIPAVIGSAKEMEQSVRRLRDMAEVINVHCSAGRS